MKNILLGTLFLVMLCALSPAKKSPVEGVWRCTPPEMNGWKGSTIKIWTKTYTSYVGEFRKDTVRFNIYGGGPYTLSGTHAVETIEFNMNRQAIGYKARMIYELRGDTLYQYYPADENWNYDLKSCNIDKYVRVE